MQPGDRLGQHRHRPRVRADLSELRAEFLGVPLGGFSQSVVEGPQLLGAERGGVLIAVAQHQELAGIHQQPGDDGVRRALGQHLGNRLGAQRVLQPVHLVVAQHPLTRWQRRYRLQHALRGVHLRVRLERRIVAQVQGLLGVLGEGRLRLVELLDCAGVEVRVAGGREPGDVRAGPVGVLAQVEIRAFDELGQVGGVGALQHRGQGALLVQVVEHRLRDASGAQDQHLTRRQAGDPSGGVRVGGVGVVDAGGVLGQPRVAEQQHNRRLAEPGGGQGGCELALGGHLGGEVGAVQAVHRHDLGGRLTVDRHDFGAAALRLIDQRRQGRGDGGIAYRPVDLLGRAGRRHRIAVQRVLADRQAGCFDDAVGAAFEQHAISELPGERLHDRGPVDAQIVEEFLLFVRVVDVVDGGHEHRGRAALRVGQATAGLRASGFIFGADVEGQVLASRVRVQPARGHGAQRLPGAGGHDDLDRPVVALCPYRIDEVHAGRDVTAVRGLVDVDGQVGLPRVVQEVADLPLRAGHLRGTPRAQPHPIARPHLRRSADPLERTLIVDNVPALVIDRVVLIELPRLAANGLHAAGCAGAGDDVGLGREHVTVTRVGEVVREAAGQRTGVAGKQRDRRARLAHDGGELARRQ